MYETILCEDSSLNIKILNYSLRITNLYDDKTIKLVDPRWY